MKLIAPDYFPQFSCLMGACRHSCCIGWEIDIDEDTLAYYQSVPGEMGERLAANISQNGETACFKLTSDERCPFLNGEGLCDLILSLGEESLCQICDDHPRFRNFFSDRTEIGLGLCCEAAGRLILGQTGKIGLVQLEDDGEEEPLFEDEHELLELRARLIAIVQDRSVSIEERVGRMLSEAQVELPPFSAERWAPFLLKLERLDDAWAERLSTLPECSSLDSAWDIPFEQLMVYLLYRHMPAALDDGDVEGHIAFCALMWRLVRSLAGAHLGQNGTLTLTDLVELARLYSSEIEYSDENIGAILDALKRSPV